MSARDSKLVATDESEEEDEKTSDEDTIPCWITYSLPLKCLLVPLVFVIAAIVLKISEGWSFLVSFYVCMQIITTIGYGDITVNNPWSMVFMTFLVLLIVFFVASLVNDLGNYVSDKEASVVRAGLTDLISKEDGGNSQGACKKYHLTGLAVAFFLFIAFAAFGTIFYATYEDCSCSFGITQEDDYPTCVDKANGTDWNGKVHGNNCASAGQSKSFLKAFYMSIITMTTVGYGDYFPVTRLGRGLAIAWMFLGVLATGNLVTAVATTQNAYIKSVQRAKKNSYKKLTEIAGADTATDTASLSRADFLEYMLFKDGLVSQEHIDHIDAVFASLKPVNNRVTIESVEEQLAQDEE